MSHSSVLGEDGRAVFRELISELRSSLRVRSGSNSHAHVWRLAPRSQRRVLSLQALHQTEYGAFNEVSTRDKLTRSDIGSMSVAMPPPEEQRAIADFLDRETAKIDTLVAKKRTLIERLKEKRTALISRTVTRGLPPDAARAAGLDPHPKLKPSGIDWLGDVPEQWATVGCASFRTRSLLALWTRPEYMSHEGAPCLRSLNLDQRDCRSRPRIHLGLSHRLLAQIDGSERRLVAVRLDSRGTTAVNDDRSTARIASTHHHSKAKEPRPDLSKLLPELSDSTALSLGGRLSVIRHDIQHQADE